MTTIKPWLERMPGRLPLTQYACTLIQVSCMYEEINELRAENAQLRAELGDLPEAQAELMSKLRWAQTENVNLRRAMADVVARAALGEKS